MLRGSAVRLLRSLATVATIVALAFSVATPASAASSGTVTITVTAFATGKTASTGCVDLYATATTIQSSLCTGVSGKYSFTHVPYGDYKVKFRNYGSVAPDQWNSRAEDFAHAQTVTVASATTALVYALLPSHSASGVVRDGSANPVAGATVGMWANYVQYGPSRTTTTDAQGRYVLVLNGTNVPLRVGGVSGLATAWSSVTTSATSQYGVDVTLAAAGGLAGTLKVPSSFTGTSACITAWSRNGSARPWSTDCAVVGQPFTLDDLPAGDVSLCIGTVESPELCTVGWLGGSYSTGTDDSTSVAVVAGATNTVDLVYGGTIVGHPTLNGEPATGGCMRAYKSEGDTVPIAEDCESDDGVYALTVGDDYPSAVVRIFFEGFPNALATRFGGFNGGVNVAGGGTAEVTVALDALGTITGELTWPDASVATAACATAYSSDPSHEVLDSDCVDSDNTTYSLHVPDVDVVVGYAAPSWDVAPQWFDGANSLATASPVRVGANETQTIDVNLEIGSALHGALTVEGSAAHAGCIDLFLGASSTAAYTECVDGAGTYAFTGLPSGDYTARVRGVPDALTTWYPGVHRQEDADIIHIGTGESVPLDIDLAVAVGLRVDVTLSGAEATGGCVYLLTPLWETAGYECADSHGAVNFDSVPTGSYSLYFEGFTGAADGYYPDSTNAGELQYIDVVAGQPRQVDATLAQGGSISGHVYMSPDEYYLGREVYLVTLAGQLVATTTVKEVNLNLVYVFENVPAGSYKIRFERTDDNQSGAWYSISGFAPNVVTMPTGPSWSLTNLDTTYYSTSGYSSFSGYLNVPDTWTSDTVCAVLIDQWENPVSADCGAPGSQFTVDKIPDWGAIVLTNGKITSGSSYAAFKGKRIWVGNATTSSGAAWYRGDITGNTYYIPVWFFSDVHVTTSGYDAISWMGDFGISTGYPDGSYRPKGKVIRQDMARFLYRLAGEPAVSAPSVSPFSDVPASNPAYEAIYWLKQEGITTSNPFNPKGNVTRKQMVMFLYRMAGEPTVKPPSKSPFKDVKTTDTGYKAIVWAQKAGITTGYGDGTFRPGDDVIRGNMATFMYRYEFQN